MYSHIINGHYMFGNTFIQPEMAKYNNIPHHFAPVNRVIPPYPDMCNRQVQCPKGRGCCVGYENGITKVDSQYTDPNKDCSECEDCPFVVNGIIRDPMATSIINIETSVIKTLKVTLYATNKDDDRTVEMKVGNRYAITYITEHGLMTSVGYLELISDSVPDECTRYINTTNMAAASTAFIGIDCSTEGHSNKCKIYISTIRNIQELEKDEEAIITRTKPNSERLDEFLTKVEKGDLIFCSECSDEPELPDNEDNDGGIDDDTLLEVPL